MTVLPFIHGFVRAISRSLGDCQLAHLARQEIDLTLAARQHLAYADALRSAGLRITVLPEAPELPDAVFVEDTALILDELTVLCRPSSPSRQGEVNAIAGALRDLGQLTQIDPPGTLEGGDVLRVGRTLFVGLSERTNREGLRQLEAIVARHGYRVIPVVVEGCLHLKTAVTSPAPGCVLANPGWVDPLPFTRLGLEVRAVPSSEPWGANVLPVNGIVLAAHSAPRTAELLQAAGLNVRALDISELQKAEAGLTCLSLLQGESQTVLP